MNRKFPVLSFVSLLLRIVGWTVVLGAAIYLIINVVIEPSQSGHRFGPGNVLNLLIGSAAALVGLITVAIGEAVGVLFAIEENTRVSHSSATRAAAIVTLFLLFGGPIPASRADEIPKEDWDQKAAQALRNAATAEWAYYAANRAYVSCSAAPECASKLPGLKVPDGVMLEMTAQGDAFSGSARHKLGTGQVFRWDTRAGGPLWQSVRGTANLTGRQTGDLEEAVSRCMRERDTLKSQLAIVDRDKRDVERRLREAEARCEQSPRSAPR
jgi:hypothetical protein